MRNACLPKRSLIHSSIFSFHSNKIFSLSCLHFLKHLEENTLLVLDIFIFSSLVLRLRKLHLPVFAANPFPRTSHSWNSYKRKSGSGWLLNPIAYFFNWLQSVSSTVLYISDMRRWKVMANVHFRSALCPAIENISEAYTINLKAEVSIIYLNKQFLRNLAFREVLYIWSQDIRCLTPERKRSVA